MKITTFIKLFFLLLSTLACSNYPGPIEVQIKCNTSEEILKENNVIALTKEGTQLTVGDIKKSSYPINESGCVIVPKETKENIIIKSGNHGLSISPDMVPEGFSEIALTPFLDYFDAWANCGINISDDQTAIKFLNPVHSVRFEDLYFNTIKLTTNELNCIVVPRKQGRFLNSDNKIIGIIEDNQQALTFLDGRTPIKGFMNVCKSIFSSD